MRKFGPISRVRLHHLTKVRRTTVSVLVRQLLEQGKLLEAGRADNPRGKKQILLRLNPEYGYIVAVEFDDELVAAAIMDLSPKINHIVRERTQLNGGVAGLIQQLLRCARQAMREAGVKPGSLVGIGIADPGLVDSRRGVTLTSSTIDFWKEIPLKQVFENEFGVATEVESKTRAKAVAERMLGAGQQCNNLIYLDYGAGIGVGVIADGGLLYGQDCGSGEFGHTHVMRGGPACKCGSIGCLEAIAGASALESQMRKALAEGATSQALALAGGDSPTITAWSILSAAKSGDKISSYLVSEMASHLGLGLANLVNLFNPSVIVLDKRLELAGDGLLHQIQQIVRRQALRSSSEHLALRFGKLGEECGLLGVGMLVLRRYFEIPALRQPNFLTDEIPVQAR